VEGPHEGDAAVARVPRLEIGEEDVFFLGVVQLDRGEAPQGLPQPRQSLLTDSGFEAPSSSSAEELDGKRPEGVELGEEAPILEDQGGEEGIFG
jgi:hypothetical protein